VSRSTDRTPFWARVLASQQREILDRLDQQAARLGRLEAAILNERVPDDDEDAVAVIEARFLARAQEIPLLVSGDSRVSEKSAATLLGVAPGTLANMRRKDRGPDWSRRPLGGAKISYFVHALAAYVAAGNGRDF
jgi:hypothetical protein